MNHPMNSQKIKIPAWIEDPASGAFHRTDEAPAELIEADIAHRVLGAVEERACIPDLRRFLQDKFGSRGTR